MPLRKARGKLARTKRSQVPESSVLSEASFLIDSLCVAALLFLASGKIVWFEETIVLLTKSTRSYESSHTTARFSRL